MSLRSWNFWTPITGTIYGFRAHHPYGGWRRIRAYYGRTAQVPWTKRAEAHLWGTSDRPAKPWADTVPGWRPNGTIEEVIAAGGVYKVWQGRTVMLILCSVEYLTIKLGRPRYNDVWNRSNPRRITKRRARRARLIRDFGLAPVVGALQHLAGAVVLVCVVLLLVAVAW